MHIIGTAGVAADRPAFSAASLLPRPEGQAIPSRSKGMPVYACYCGDCDNLALQAEGDRVFFAQDALGCTWACAVSRQTENTAEFLSPDVLEMMKAQQLAHRKGNSREGTRMMLLDCPDEVSLRHRLILDTYPPAEESMARLEREG